MCMKATPEGCELREELKGVKTATAALDKVKALLADGKITTAEHDWITGG